MAYASRILHKAELNYSTTEREALALVWAVNYFRPYLYGRRFTLITDHCPLSWLKTLPEPRGRLARWILVLSEYDWSNRHRSGKQHGNADGLSRIRPVPGPDEISPSDGSHRLEDLMGPYESPGQCEPCIQQQYSAVGFEPSWTPEELSEMQRNDQLLALAFEWFPRCPLPCGIWRGNSKLASLRKVWHQLVIEEGVMYRVKPLPPAQGGGERKVLAVPQQLVSEVLRMTRVFGSRRH